MSGGLVASPFPGITPGTWCIQVPSGGRKQFRGGAQEVKFALSMILIVNFRDFFFLNKSNKDVISKS